MRRAASTQRTYNREWAAWAAWAASAADTQAISDPYALLADYMVQRWRRRAGPATLDLIYAALRDHHESAHLDWPDPDQTIPRRWRLARRRKDAAGGRTPPLTAEHLAVIERACGIHEHARVLALGMTMRDGLLTTADAAQLRWSDLRVHADGSGSLSVGRDDRIDRLWMSGQTVQALEALRPATAAPGDCVFGVRLDGQVVQTRPQTIGAWISRAAATAGLGTGYNGRSPRYGMLLDLPPDVGRAPMPEELAWANKYQNPEIVRHYLGPQGEHETTARGLPADTATEPADGEFDAAAFAAWLQEGGFAASRALGEDLEILDSTVRRWRFGQSRIPSWLGLALAALGREEGSDLPSDDALGLQHVPMTGGWAPEALAAVIDISGGITFCADLVLRQPRAALHWWVREEIVAHEMLVPPAARHDVDAAVAHMCAADRHDPDKADYLAHYMSAGGWSVDALAAALGVRRQTVQRWRSRAVATPLLVVRFTINELELRVPRAVRSGRGAADALQDPAIRALRWQPAASTPR